MILFDSGRIYEHSQEIATMLRQQQAKLEKSQELLREYTALNMRQQAEIDALKNANRFIQNFAEEQHQRAVALEMRELTDEEIEQVRVAIMGAAYWCADENMSEAYNAVKVCCSEVLEILRKAQEK